ncbi:glycoside hydrolase family 71/99-like protein [Kibdelosporangium aridum]|uniref:glycoside hydrolase family 71/99-like protein n=1 Tax=Kibdelosporangium aridum TaxID=2030 RepID=UPI0035EE73B2
MGLTRRSFLALTGTSLLITPRPALAASPPGDVVGKITVGYQGWFACAGDGAPINGWWHWSHNWGQPPSLSNNVIKAWPDMREYTRTYRTAYPALNNGQPAALFSSYDQSTVDIHFRWMQQYGCDTAALQRFNPVGGEGPTRDAMATKVRTAAEATGRKFYIMYDVTNWTDMQSQIKTDWSSKMSALTSSSAYARQNGKPVVGIWGFGFNDSGRPWGPGPCLDVINWFKGQNCYVMGGVPTWWRTGTGDSRPGFLDVYRAFDMISPWMVGRIGNMGDSDRLYNEVTVPDQSYCNANGIDYQPCVLPGDVAERQRAHGDLMWRQFYNVVRAGAQGIYISMFDEYNEGNQIAKTAENASMVPSGSGLWALDEDGTPCSSDYYLRLTADGGRMLKGQLGLTPTRPTRPVL